MPASAAGFERQPRSKPAQIPASCRTSAFADSLAAPQQALGASYCFVGIGSVSWLVAAARLPFRQLRACRRRRPGRSLRMPRAAAWGQKYRVPVAVAWPEEQAPRAISLTR
jgi:hypothetical protein